MMRQVDWERLHAAYPDIIFDISIDTNISTEETDTIINALKRSTWLRRNIHSLYRLYKWLPRLASGYYDDFVQTNNADTGNSTYERLSAENLENLFTVLGDK